MAIRCKVFPIGLAMLALSATAAAADGAACRKLSDAMLATSATPYHSASIITFGMAGERGESPPSSRTSETIFTGTTIFVRFGSGNWKELLVPLDKLKELVRRKAESFTDCQYLDDENLNGIVLSVYAGHSVTQELVTEMKVWISRDRGLLIRSETDVVANPALEGGPRGRHISIRYNYENVAVPADAQ